MQLDIISYQDLLSPDSSARALSHCSEALQNKGILGIKGVPDFERKTREYIAVARAFFGLSEQVKEQYKPNRDALDTEGYELGAEKFLDQNGQWQIDDKKASYYAFVPDVPKNKWPKEVDLKTSYLALSELIFNTGKLLLAGLKLDEVKGVKLGRLRGHGRMLHYHKEHDTNTNPNWCGAHLDHGVLTGLVPAYYFRDGKEVDEPEEAGLYIVPTNGNDFEKIHANDKSILLFQIGEFGQLASNDKVRATKHAVKKSLDNIERFTLALFCDTPEAVIQSSSVLIKDPRYAENRDAEGCLSYANWEIASYAQYRAK